MIKINQLNKVIISFVIVMLATIICSSKVEAEKIYPSQEFANENPVTWASMGTYSVDGRGTYNHTERMTYNLERIDGNYALRLKTGNIGLFVEVSDEHGVIGSQWIGPVGGRIILSRLPEKVIIKCGYDWIDERSDDDSSWTTTYKYRTLSVSNPVNLSSLNSAKLEIKNAFVAPDNTIHQYYPAVANSDGTYTYPRFIKYASDGTTVLDYYAAYTYEYIDPKVISGPKRIKYLMESTPVQGNNEFAMGQISFGNNEFAYYTLQRIPNQFTYLQQFDWDSSKGQFGPSKILEDLSYMFPMIGSGDDSVFWYGAQGITNMGFYSYVRTVTGGIHVNRVLRPTGKNNDEGDPIEEWVVEGTSNIVQFNYVPLSNVYSGEWLGLHYKWSMSYQTGYMQRWNLQTGFNEQVTGVIWSSPEAVADRDWREVNYMLVKSAYNGNNWEVANAPISKRFEVNGAEYATSHSNVIIMGSNPPTMDCQKPTENQVLNNASASMFVPEISVSDPDNDHLTCEYYIDSEASPRDRRTISNTATPQIVSYIAFDTSILTEGMHTIRFVVSDGINAVQKSVTFTIDKTGPTFQSYTKSSTANSITISANVTDASGLDAAPYKYNIDTLNTQWVTDASFTAGSLSPNTRYYTSITAKDKVGNQSTKSEYVYTKAQTPVISTNTPKENSLNLVCSDSNPAGTQYQIMFNNSYVNQSGILTGTPVWITLSGKALTVSGLSQNTSYQIKAKARNGDGAETAFGNVITSSTLASAPNNITFIPSQTTMTVKWDAVPYAVSYNVEKDGVAVNNIKGTSYTFNGLTPETGSNYRVSTTTAAGTGNWSSTLIKATYPNPPTTPSNFHTTDSDISQRSIGLFWDESIRATGYVIENNGTEIRENGTVKIFTGKSTILNDLMPDTEYKYRIKAVNIGGDSTWSEYLTVVTLPDIPDVPGSVSATKTNTSVKVVWGQSLRAESYEIEVDGRIFSTGKATEYLHEGLTALSNHTYMVRARNRAHWSEWSQLLNVTTNPDKPSIPNNIMATADKSYTTLTWYLVPYAEKYDIEIDRSEIKTVTGLTFKNIGLNPGTTHTYRISARNVTGSSDWSEPVTISTLPEADQSMTSITNVVAVVTNSYITIAWDDVDKDAEYIIEVDGVLQDIGKDRVYNHTGLSANQYHTYKVKAKTTTNQEFWCAVLSLSTLPDPPEALTGVEATAYDSQIEIKWNKSDEVTYDIEVDGETIDNGQNNTYTHQNLNPGTEHTYRVRAKNETGVTAWSTAISKSTKLPEYTVKCTRGNAFDFSILASNVQDFTGLKFVITFDENDLDIEDLCSFTPEKNTESGTVNGTKLTVTREAGKIIITVKDNIVPGTSWSGELNNILFKSKIDGESKISVVVEK